ncbi:hypothetical protein [Actinoplanes sp. NPDC089786]|uniref:hypothetical protein n=1 Tax=Actinoplanes sp. NPDC089786 TaxID=3155185 RepID=UPI0034233534
MDEEQLARTLAHERFRLGELRNGMLEGWSPPAGSGDQFDVVAATIPAVHRYHELKEPGLNEVTYAVFPAYRCESTGRETQREAEDRFDRMLDPANLKRLPTPWLRMRYDNPRTGGGSVGTELGLGPPRQAPQRAPQTRRSRRRLDRLRKFPEQTAPRLLGGRAAAGRRRRLPADRHDSASGLRAGFPFRGCRR